MNNRQIGVFDSGIGGLTVLREIIKLLPNEEYIYYADIDNVPYGTKTKEDVIKYVEKAVGFLVKKEVKAIVIACNTATSIAINSLRKKYEVPIIGIEPAIKPAIENMDKKKVMIMATPITIKEEKLHNLLKKFNKEESIDLVPMPKLVEFAENGEFESDKVTTYICTQLKEFNLEDYSEVVLGCTHFPYFKKIFEEIFDKKTNIIDGNQGVANRLKDVLKSKELLGSNKLKVEYYYSGRIVKDIEELRKIDQLLM